MTERFEHTGPTDHAIEVAVAAANRSPCQKSKRGVVIYSRQPREQIFAQGYNHPIGQECDGSETCRRECGRICLHAEQVTLLAIGDGYLPGPVELVHIKTVDGSPVPSGPPSCDQCSKLILAFGRIDYVWLLETMTANEWRKENALPPIEDGGMHLISTWKRYTAHDFHRETLKNCGLRFPFHESEIERLGREVVQIRPMAPPDEV